MPMLGTVTRQARSIFSQYGVIIWVSLLLVFGTLFVTRQQDEIRQIGQALAAADVRWLVLIVALQLVALTLSGATYQVILRRLGHRIGLHHLVDLHLQRHVVGTLTPVGGPASVYVLIRNLGRRGVQTEDAVLTTTLRSATGYASFVLLLIPTFLLHKPSAMTLIGGGILIGALVVLAMAIWLLLHESRREHAPGRLQRHMPARVVGFVNHARQFDIRFADLAPAFGVAFAQNLVNAATLYAALRAMHLDISPVIVLVGFTAGSMFSIIAPVFQGIGLVEMSMAVALQQMGVPISAAVGAALLFRLGDLWLPLVLGLGAQAGRQEVVRSVASHVPQISAAAIGVGAVIAGLSQGYLLPVLGSSSTLGPEHLASLLVALGGAGMLSWAFGHWRQSPVLRTVAVGNLAIVVPVVGLLYLPHLSGIVGAFSLLG